MESIRQGKHPMTPDLAEAVRRACDAAIPDSLRCVWPNCGCLESDDHRVETILTTLLADARDEGAKAEREAIAALMEQPAADDDLQPALIKRVRQVARKQRAAAIRARSAAKEEK